MANYKTVPNQKVVKVQKQLCNKVNLYATINIEAMEAAAQDLKAGAFKLWVYFAKNQDGFQFALSSRDVLDTFGIKKDQYDSAIKELLNKGYLVETGGNQYIFNEVVGKDYNDKNSVVGKNHNAVVVKNHNQLQEKTTTGCSKKPQEIIQDNINNTKDNTQVQLFQPTAETTKLRTAARQEYLKVSKEWLEENSVKYNILDKNIGYIVATGKLIEVIDIDK